jgi:hypothetical protein
MHMARFIPYGATLALAGFTLRQQLEYVHTVQVCKICRGQINVRLRGWLADQQIEHTLEQSMKSWI